MWLCRRRERGRGGERGSVSVEFALILIPFLVLIFGVIQYSMYFWSTQSSAAAAREAARRAAVGDQDCIAFRNAAADAVKLEAGTVTATRQYYASTDNTFSTPMATPPIGANVKVTISYNSFDFHFPFLPFISNGAVNERAYARVENPTASSVPCT